MSSLNKTVKTDARTVARYNARVKANNAKFRKLSLQEQRIAIAEDVIDQLRSKKLIAKSGNGYLVFDDKVERLLEDQFATDPELDNFKEMFEDGNEFDKYKHLLKKEELAKLEDKAEPPDLSVITMQTSCEVCGIGSMFVSTVEKCDKIKCLIVQDGEDDSEDIREREVQMEYMSKWFDEDQLLEIEDYFEQHTYKHDGDSPIMDQSNDTKRLIMIMENIISNKGKFDPENGKHRNR